MLVTVQLLKTNAQPQSDLILKILKTPAERKDTIMWVPLKVKLTNMETIQQQRRKILSQTLWATLKNFQEKNFYSLIEITLSDNPTTNSSKLSLLFLPDPSLLAIKVNLRLAMGKEVIHKL